MTIVSAKTLSRDDLKFLGSNVSSEVLSDRRQYRIIRYIPAQVTPNRRRVGSRHRFDLLVAAEVK